MRGYNMHEDDDVVVIFNVSKFENECIFDIQKLSRYVFLNNSILFFDKRSQLLFVCIVIVGYILL